jgi:DNA-binding transcriptional MerR regulator
MQESGVLRIGELSRRSGISVELLRAWERRYGLMKPARTAGGLRLYSEEDLERVRAMRSHIASGVAAAEAAALVLREVSVTSAPPFEQELQSLAAALERFDEPAAQSLLDRTLSTYTLNTVLTDLVLPYLRMLGERWERGEVSVAQEHFASGVLRGRLVAMARAWGQGAGPVALLACLPGEQHDIGLIAFGLALQAQGWRIVYLGVDTPIEMVEQVSAELDPRLVVLSTVTRRRARAVLERLAVLAGRRPLALGGAGIRNLELDSLGISPLLGDPVSEAQRVTELVRSG